MIEIRTRPATTEDLTAINRVIDAAVMNWPVQNRNKRRMSAVLQYSLTDMDHMSFLVATLKDEVIGVAVWESAGHENGLFHGLYVLPVIRGQGIGRRLMSAVSKDASGIGVTGLLIKAQRVTRSYFEHRDLKPLEAQDDEYPWQYWMQVA